MITYPKIDTLYDRNPVTRRVEVQSLRRPEFDLIDYWHVTEKIDGTNVRVGWADGRVTFAGRTDRAELPAPLLAHLTAVFTAEKLSDCFEVAPGQEVVLFGEGYGEKIQGNPLGRVGVSFRLFDVWVGGHWLEPENITDVAGKLAVPEAPVLQDYLAILPISAARLADCIPTSHVAREEGLSDVRAEGIIARTVPGLFCRDGRRLMWKLKFKDFDLPRGQVQ